MTKPLFTEDDISEVRAAVHSSLYELEEIKAVCKLFGYENDTRLSNWIKYSLRNYKDLQEATKPTTQNEFMEKLVKIYNDTGSVVIQPTDTEAILLLTEQMVEAYLNIRKVIRVVSPDMWRKIFEDLE